jgi:uncharacterized membrane protein
MMMKRELNILIAAVFIWTAGIVAAPVFTGTWFSEQLYRLYAVVCHQFDERSFHWQDHPFGVCIRCTSIYLSFLAALILVRFQPRLQNADWKALRILAVTGIPIALDGIGSLLSLWDSTLASRVFTGLLFGAGLALLLHADLTESIRSLEKRIGNHYESETR